MKWNWGTKIAIFYTTFVLFIIGMVVLSFQQQFDLVTEDYYAEEIKYQETIDSKQNASELSEPLRFSIDKPNLIINFPSDSKKIEGSINCFRPSDQNKDFEVQMELDNSKYSIPLNRFVKGAYILKISWTSDKTKYYQEETIIIP